jgi:4-amino-4-deoxy-L-arabinose transferase-like glycosyltransferase
MHPPPPDSRLEPPPAARGAPRRLAWTLAALGAASLALRLVRLGSQSLWIDEVLSYGWIQEIDRNGLGSLVHDIHGPLHALAIWMTSRISTSEWWLRFPSAVAGALAVPAIGALGGALWGNRAGIVAAVALALSPFALYYAQECRGYSFTILFAALSLHAALRFVRAPSARRGAAVIAAELLGIASSLNGLFFAMGIGLWGLLVLRRRRPALAGWIAAHAVVVLLLFPYARQVTHQVRPERLVGVETDFGAEAPLRGATTLHPMAVPYTAYAFAAGYSLGPTLEELRADASSAARPRYLPYIVAVALGFGVPCAAGLWRAARSGGAGLLLLPAAVTLGFTVWLAAANVKPYNVRYLSVVLPAFLLLVAYGLVVLPRVWSARLGGLALVVCLLSSANYLFVPRYGRDDVRGATAFVARAAGPNDPVVQIALTGALRHYYVALGRRPLHPPAGATASAEAARAWVAEKLRGAGTAWYMECRPESLDPDRHLRRALLEAARSTSLVPFVGIRVYRLELGEAQGASSG